MKYNYEEVINIIQNTRRFGKFTGYEVSKRMLEQLGNPQESIPFVHIAGTNGKGSTTAFLCEILKQAGKKVGMFTSPHLVTFEERIRINGIYISKEDVTRIGNQLLEMEFDVPPTMFDYCLCMAVLYFKEQKCDLMVMETGIGGRFDSTNALGTPLVSVITKIGFDHMAILGNTLEEIAYEKAGIIKKGVPVVLQRQDESAYRVIKNYVYEVNSSLLRNEFRDRNREFSDKIDKITSEYLIQVSQPVRDFVFKLPRKMLGNFQIENAATAVLAAVCIFQNEEIFKNVYEQELEQQRINNSTLAVHTEFESIEKQIADKIIKNNESSKQLSQQLQMLPKFYLEYIKKGISQAVWKGRMELVNENPFFMIDGAHNPDGVHALAESLKTLYPNEKFHFIMAVMADKDYENMIEELIPLAIDFVTVTPEYNRALQSKELAECITKKGIKATYVENMKDVIVPLLPQKDGIITKKCDKVAFKNHKTVAFGSLYFIGEIESLF